MSWKHRERFLSYCFYRLLRDIGEGASLPGLKFPFSFYPTFLSCLLMLSGSERTYNNQILQHGVNHGLTGGPSC